jgi:hypothetical protein
MTDHDIWKTEPDGTLAAEVDGLRLVVQAPKAVGGMAHFLVLRRHEMGEAIIGSGTEANVRAAMKAAVKMAERMVARPFGKGLAPSRP